MAVEVGTDGLHYSCMDYLLYILAVLNGSCCFVVPVLLKLPVLADLSARRWSARVAFVIFVSTLSNTKCLCMLCTPAMFFQQKHYDTATMIYPSQ